MFGALIAFVVPFFILCGGKVLALHLEKSTIHQTAPGDFFIKNQGLALQRAAAQTPDVLLLYGSSELIDPVPNRASEFFTNGQRGFEVCPVGRAGATPLTMLQKMAALGSDLRDRKVAIFVSPSFFFRQELDRGAYAGNFSLAAASGTIFGTALDLETKRDVARRMSSFPDTLSQSTLLKTAVDCLASDRPFDRLMFATIRPLGMLQNLVLDLQDHFESLFYILSGGKKLSHRSVREVIQPLEAGEPDLYLHAKALRSFLDLGPEKFRARIDGAHAWIDLELLFRTLAETHVNALVLSMPFDGNFYDAHGIPRFARDVYYQKLRALSARYGIELREFEDHDEDAAFQIPRREHPTVDGWTYFNRAIEDFFDRG